ncbi:unnamed protein product [Urochloa humidicola]
MEEEETRLRFALIAQVGNASREFSAADVSRAVAEAAGIDADHFPATKTFLESYLVICSSQAARDRALGVSPVPLAATFLSLRPWTRLVRATARTLYHKVGIEMDGIPEHAWNLDTASKLLAKHVWIERLDPATANKIDMTTFKLTAWTKDPLAIPTEKTLCVVEPERQINYSDDEMERIFANVEPYLRQKIIFEYPITIHLRSIADFSPRTPSSSEASPSDDGDSGPDGNPNRSYGFRRGVGPRISGFPRRRDDSAGGAGNGAVGAGNGGRNKGPQGGRTQNAVQEPNDKSKAEAAGQNTELQKNFPKVDSNTSSLTRSTSTDPAPAATAINATVPGREVTQLVVDVPRPNAADGSVATGNPATLPDMAAACATTTRAEPMREFDPMLAESELGGDADQQADPCAQAEHGGQTPSHHTPIHHGSSANDRSATATHVACLTKAAVVMHPAVPPATVVTPPNFQDGAMSQTDGDGPCETEPNSTKTKRTAPESSKDVRGGLPKRSSRLASHPLANVPSAKRAEVVLMHHFELIPEPAVPNTDGKKAYEKLYKDGLMSKNLEAIRDLTPALKSISPILGMQA